MRIHYDTGESISDLAVSLSLGDRCSFRLSNTGAREELGSQAAVHWSVPARPGPAGDPASFALLDGRTDTSSNRVELTTSLVVRASTAPPRKKPAGRRAAGAARTGGSPAAASTGPGRRGHGVRSS